ncbi:hypothetical protein J8J14_18215 [Roseomonas sp. SSH11]|uniref:Uncharacterized protein n=1 Tax=Pararoseomonas baculiformis TaxID=2820812 RepID=A0ABS4AI66_9PROT|nr:hypothetical protein [Pararoseomonas baculiformis]
MTTASMAEFARLHSVSRKTAYEWKTRGYLRFSGALIDVEASNANLSAAGRSRLDSVTLKPRIARTVRKSVTPRVTGDTAWSAEMGHRHAEEYSLVLTLACVVSGAAIDITEALQDRIPLAELRPIVEGIITRIRKGAAECADEDGTPPGFDSWGDHPWFTEPPLTEAEWKELEDATHGHAG